MPGFSSLTLSRYSLAMLVLGLSSFAWSRYSGVDSESLCGDAEDVSVFGVTEVSGEAYPGIFLPHVVSLLVCKEHREEGLETKRVA